MDQKFWAEFSKEAFVDKFVGREELLRIVDEAIADAPNNHLITFVGRGGIGKTALLRRIYNKYKNKQNIVIMTFYFANAGVSSILSLVESMIDQLLRSHFLTLNEVKPLKNTHKMVREALLEGKNKELVEELEYQTYKEFVNVFSSKQKKSNKRLLMLADSFDEISRNLIVSEDEILFDNVVEILAERPNNDVNTYFESLLPKAYRAAGWNYQGPLRLDKFSPAETTEYFTKVFPATLKPELIEIIHILTEGKPILLALTIEWFKHNVQLPLNINKSKEELEALSPFHLRMLRLDFEFGLVRRVVAVRSLLEKALLFLSFLDRRYDKRILQLALDRPIETIEKLEPQLRSMAFIRSFLDDNSGLLHDEAKYLINEYAWPPYDPKRTDRRLLARKVIDDFYLPEIARLRAEAATKDASEMPAQLSAELLAHELEMECLDYHYRISLDEGRRYLTRLIDEGVSLRKREGIRHEISKRVGEHEAEVAVARMELRRGQYEGVREALEGALKDEALSDWYRMTLEHELSHQ